MAGVKREQGDDLENALNTRQDRNASLTDGGILTWDSGTGTLTWGSVLRLRIPGVGVFTAAPSSLGGIAGGGDAVYVVISRTTAGTMTPAVLSLANAAHITDTRYVLAVRGTDGKLYFRNGSVFTSGDSKAFGMLNSKTDRAESIANGVALQAVGFTYVMATDQLVVYVGGILQKKGLHYNETSTTQITFLAPYIPGVGELITFLNVIGGEGPAGSVNMQQAYTNGASIDVTPGTPLEMTSSGGAGSTTLFRAGHASSPGGVGAIVMSRDGQQTVNRIFLRDYTTGLEFGILEVDTNGNLRLRSANGGSEYGIQINADGTGIEFGRFPTLGIGGITGGAVKMSVFSGTTSAGAETVAATGITNIKGVVVSVYHSGLAKFLSHSYASANTASREFYVTYDAAGNVNISGGSDGLGVVPLSMRTQPYNITVFH